MNKFLLLALSAAAVVSCKKNPVASDPTIDPSNDLISLAVGSASKAGNQGVRSELFESGDQIGVLAAFSDNATAPSTPAPDWNTALYFDNKPATWLSNSTGQTPDLSSFGWGPAGEGGTAHNQYYPSKVRGIFIYAYYPYSATKYTAPDGTGSMPLLPVTLSDGPIKGDAADANLVQADVLYYTSGNDGSSSTLTPFSSASKMGTMNFEHALAQLRFMIKRPSGAAKGKVVKLEFKTVKEATMDITTGDFDYTNVAAYDDAVYTIEPPVGTDWEVPEDDATPTFEALDILDKKPLMIFPLALADAKKGSLVLTVDFSTTTTPDTKEITVDLATLQKALEKGKLNTYTLSVGFHEIELKASISAWDQNGSDNDLDAE